MKNIARTYITRASQLHFVNNYLYESNANLSECDDVLNSEPLLLKSSTIGGAVTLKEHIMSHDVNSHAKSAITQRIVIGAAKILKLSDRQLRDIQHWIRESFPSSADAEDENYPEVAHYYSKVLVNNEIGVATVYQTGDVVAVKDAYAPNTEWIMELETIIVYGPMHNQFWTFIDGQYYAPQMVRGTLSLEQWTRQPKLEKRHYANLGVQRCHLLERKLMLYPDPSHRDYPTFYLAVDTENFVEPIAVDIPYYPQVDEVAEVQHQNSTLYVLVQAVDDSTRKFSGVVLHRVRGSTRYNRTTRTESFDVKQVIKITSFTLNHGCYYLR